MPNYPPQGADPSGEPHHGLSKDLKDALFNALKKKFPQSIADSKYDKIEKN